MDNIPIRVFNNLEKFGVPYLNKQAMRVYSSLWDADNWATQGGRVKTDWTKAPFTAYYRNFDADACIYSHGSSLSCESSTKSSMEEDQTWQNYGLDAKGRNVLRWVQKKYMIYNYCTDFNRFPQGLPEECKRSRFL